MTTTPDPIVEVGRFVHDGRLCNQIFRNIAVSVVAEKHDLFVDYYNYQLIPDIGIILYIGEKSINRASIEFYKL